MITACQNDFALVGTSALFLSTVDDMVGCKDQAGAATGLPDVAAIVTGVPESCSPVTFPVNPPQLICSTKDQHPQTYYGNQGDAKYLLKTHKNDLHGALLVGQRHQGRAARRDRAHRHREQRRHQGRPEAGRSRAATRRARTRRS